MGTLGQFPNANEAAKAAPTRQRPKPAKRRLWSAPECAEDGCDVPPIARNLCGKHYQRRKIAGTLPPKIRVSYAGHVACAVRDCTSQAVARTYCGRHARLANRYGLSAEQLATLPLYCEACGSTDRLHVDHDHETGVYRGVLCASCNTALGLLGEDVDRFLNLGRYLTRTR